MKSAEFKFDIAEKMRQQKRIFKQHAKEVTTLTFKGAVVCSLIFTFKKYIYTKKSSKFANLLLEKPGIDLLHLVLFISN